MESRRRGGDVPSQKSGAGEKHDVLRRACKEQGGENLIKNVKEVQEHLKKYYKDEHAKDIGSMIPIMALTELFIEEYMKGTKYNQWESKVSEITNQLIG